jgi:hypothetical protein
MAISDYSAERQTNSQQISWNCVIDTPIGVLLTRNVFVFTEPEDYISLSQWPATVTNPKLV